jgi:DNA mismatch repair ATPase MutL
MMDVNLTPNKREVLIRKEILEKVVKDLKEKITEKVI